MSSTGSGRERILHEAERLFGERGYEGVSIRDIATACDLTNAALYYHFENKEDLFLEMAAAAVRRIAGALQEACEAGGNSRARLGHLLARQMELMSERRDVYLGLRRDLAQLHSPRARQFLATYWAALLAPLADLIAGAQLRQEIHGHLDPHRLAGLLMGMLHGMYSTCRLHEGRRPTLADVEQVVAVFWDGAGLEPENQVAEG